MHVDVRKEEPVKVLVSNAWKEGQNAKTGMEIQQWWDVGKAKIKQVIQEYRMLKKQSEMAKEENRPFCLIMARVQVSGTENR